MPVPTTRCIIYTVPTRCQEGTAHWPPRRGTQGISPVGSEHSRCTEATLQGPPQQPRPQGMKTSSLGSPSSLICIRAPLYKEPCTEGGPATKGDLLPPAPRLGSELLPPLWASVSSSVKSGSALAPLSASFQFIMRLKQ